MSNIVPKHIGIIMDGNRRWANSRGLPKLMGHKVGAQNVVEITKAVNTMGVKYLTLWALSVDNLNKRDNKEVVAIIKLINSIESYLEKMKISNLRFDTIGNIEKLPKKSRDILEKIKIKTANNTGITLIIGLIYGGQDEIIRATKKIINSGINPENLNKEEFRKFLDTGKFPQVDLIIRTGGNIRHSGFLLFDSEYSEYAFLEKGWPDFNSNDLQDIINDFSKSKRTFGG